MTLPQYLPNDAGWQGSPSAYLALRVVVVSQTYNASTNQSTLTVKLQGRFPGSFAYNDTFSLWALNGRSGTLKCNGATLVQFPSTGSIKYTVAAKTDNTWSDVLYNNSAASWTVTVTHDDNGTAACNFVLDAYAQSSYGNTTYNTAFTTKSATLTWTEIRRSTINTCSSSAATLGNISLTMNRTGSLYHKAQVKLGSTVLTTTGSFTTSATISVPRSWFSSKPNDTSFSVTVSVQSYTDISCTTACGDPDTRTVTITADAGMKPVLQSGYATAAPYNTGTAAAGINKFVSGYSKATVTLDSSKLDMSAAVGATVSSISVTGGGVTATSAPYRTGVLRDTATITVTVTDSRGRSGTLTLSVTTLVYSNPRLSAITVIRCNSSGTEAEDGAYYAVTATLTISSLDGANSATLTANGNALTSGTRRILGGSLNADQSYTVTILGEDALGNTAMVTVVLPGRKWAMRFREDGNGVGFGMTPEIGFAIEIPESWGILIGAHKIWGKRVGLNAGGSTTVQLSPWTQYLVTPDYGQVWIVQTRAANQQPLVATAFSAVSNSNISCTAGSDCTITLQNTHSSYSYAFDIRKL